MAPELTPPDHPRVPTSWADHLRACRARRDAGTIVDVIGLVSCKRLSNEGRVEVAG